MHHTTTALVNHIDHERILPNIRATKADALVRELAAHLAAHYDGLDKDEVAEVLLDRERQSSTAIGEGVAVPHGKLGSIDTLAVVLGRSVKGIDFDSPDGLPCHFFFVVISPVGAAGRHLKLLARFSQVFKSAEFRSRLLKANAAEEMYALIAEQDAK
jgi:nitrogen PTS system EIIA component